MSELKKQTKEINTKSKIFYFLMGVILIISIIIGINTNGQAVANILFQRENNQFYFSDFFGSVRDTGISANAYDNAVIYPPLAVMFFNFVAKFFPLGLTTPELKNTSMGMVCILLYYVLTSVVFVLLVHKLKKSNKTDKLLFSFFMLTSLPMVWMFERGNVVNIAFVCLLFYIYGYDSKNKWIRQFSYIALAISTAFKVYPVIFGLLLLRKKNNLKNILSCIGWGVGFFFVPFFFTGGLKQLPTLISNTLYTSSSFGEKGYGFKVGLNTIFNFLGEVTGHNYAFSLAANAAVIFIAISAILLLLFGKFNAKWKLVAVGSIFLVIIPGFSFIYNIIYMIIPLMMFLDEKKQSKLDYIYAVLFSLQFAFMVATNRSFLLEINENELMMNITTFIQAISLYIITALLWIEGIISSFKYNKDKKIINVGIALVLVATVLFSGAYSYKTTPEKSNFAVTSLPIFKAQTDESKLELNEYLEFANSTFKDNDVVAFPRIPLVESNKKTSFYDIAYYSNSIHTTKSLKKKMPTHIVIFDVYGKDLESCAKSISKAEVEKYETMGNDIKKFCFSNGYQKIKAYKINEVCQLTIWQKTKQNKNLSWRESGKGTIEDPYIIATPDQFVAFSDYVNAGHSMYKKHIKLACDIDMSKCENFKPIANEKGIIEFKGIFNGDGHSVKNLTIKANKNLWAEEFENVALFGAFSGTIMNLTIEDSYFFGKNVSAFARLTRNQNATIINCMSKNNNFDGVVVGEIASNYRGSIISTVAIGTKSNSQDTDIIGFKNRYVNLNAVYTNCNLSTHNNAYTNTNSIKSNMDMLNACAEEYYLKQKPDKNYSSLLFKWDKNMI